MVLAASGRHGGVRGHVADQHGGGVTSHPHRALTSSLRSLLTFIAEGGDRGRMQLQICANGASERTKLQRLFDAGWVERCDFKLPRETLHGVRATPAGLAVLLPTASQRTTRDD
jgi:hypothetical protein